MGLRPYLSARMPKGTKSTTPKVTRAPNTTSQLGPFSKKKEKKKEQAEEEEKKPWEGKSTWNV